MTKIILVDLGASRIKAVLYDIVRSEILDAEECISPSVKSFSNVPQRFEVHIEEYWECLLKTAGKIILRNSNSCIKKLWICSEMHGFVLADLQGNAITNYISWKDQRAIFDDEGGESTLYKFNAEFKSYLSITGMNLKAGLPVLTLASGINKGTIPELVNLEIDQTVRVLSLVDWLLFRGGELNPKVNITLAAGLGIYDLKKRTLSHSILDSKLFAPIKIAGLQIQNHITESLGKIRIYDSEISIFGGIGDFQAAIQGAKLSNNFNAVLNLGTGSQVAVRSSEISSSSEHEIRLLADGSFVNVITHIPCGRALNVFASFLDSYSNAGGGRDIFWEIWSKLTLDDVMESKLISNLALFESAWVGDTGVRLNGSIGLDENSSSVRDVISGIAKSWLLQYSDALKKLDPSSKSKNVVICGGVGHKSKFAVSVLKKLMPERHFSMAPTLTGEETIDGLLQLALGNN